MRLFRCRMAFQFKPFHTHIIDLDNENTGCSGVLWDNYNQEASGMY